MLDGRGEAGASSGGGATAERAAAAVSAAAAAPAGPGPREAGRPGRRDPVLRRFGRRRVPDGREPLEGGCSCLRQNPSRQRQGGVLPCACQQLQGLLEGEPDMIANAANASP